MVVIDGEKWLAPGFKDEDMIYNSYPMVKPPFLQSIPRGWIATFVETCEKCYPPLFKSGADPETYFHFVRACARNGGLHIDWYLSSGCNTSCMDDLENLWINCEEKTRHICHLCGEPAHLQSIDYMLPYCDSCAAGHLKDKQKSTPNSASTIKNTFRKI